MMGNVLVCGIVQEIGRSLYRFIFDEAPMSTRPIHVKRNPRPVLTLDLFSNNDELVVNKPQKTFKLDSAKRLLVGLVKKDNEEYFLNQEPLKFYYTGNVGTFPSTIALNKLYYFMPHIKGKCVRDIYLIKIVRVGSKTEIRPEVEDKKAPQLVFELEYLKSLSEYKMIHLNFQHSFTDTFLGRVMTTRKMQNSI